MSQETDAERRRRGRRPLAAVWVPLFFGLLSLFNMFNKPRFAALHGSDVVQLIATGMCFGVALVTLILFFRGSSSR
ncbi:MAG TPA: hypothetical protein VH763_08525 [Gemmatimonadales bacterium]|jgi:hypothetical protein